MADISEPAVTKACTKVKEIVPSAPRVETVKCDVSKEADVQAMIESQDSWGGTDVIFNNAGIMHGDDADAVDTPEKIWDLTHAINVKGVWYGSKHAVLSMRRHKKTRGSIINTASVVALVGSATPQLAYTASKGAVLALTRELAVVHAREGFRFNALCPAPLNTPLLQDWLGDDQPKRFRREVHFPTGRFGEAIEQAHAVVFLASDESSFVNGTDFVVDGGMSRVRSSYTPSTSLIETGICHPRGTGCTGAQELGPLELQPVAIIQMNAWFAFIRIRLSSLEKVVSFHELQLSESSVVYFTQVQSAIITRLVETANRPTIEKVILLQPGRPMQLLIMRAMPTSLSPLDRDTVIIQQRRNLLTSPATLKVRAVQETKVFGAGGLPGKPQAVDVGAEVLVHLQRRARRPVRVAAVRPWDLGPARVHECRRLGDVFIWEHLAQNSEHLVFRLLVGHVLDAVRLVRDDGHEDDVRPGEEIVFRQALPDRVVPARLGIRVQEILRVLGPEGLVELHEDLGVRAHLELVDRRLLPVGQFWREIDGVLLQHTDRERAQCVGGVYAGSVRVVHRHSVVRVLDVCDLSVETQTGVILLKEGGSFAFDDGAVSALVNDEVILVAELVEG